MISEKREKSREEKAGIGCSIAFMVPAAIIFLAFGKMFIGFLVGGICATAYFIWFLSPASVPKKDRMIEFYEVCLSNGIRNLDDVRNRKRAELIAEEVGLDPRNIYHFYAKGKKYVEQITDKMTKEREKAIYNKLKAEEKERYEALTRYANMRGNAKTIAILTDKIWSIRQTVGSLDNFEANASHLFLEKEKDWAVAGGIASGIAGGAAGLAVALDIQAENAEIRARNAEKKKFISEATPLYKSLADESREELLTVQAEIEKEKLKLVGDIPAEKLLTYLKFKYSKVTVSKTGAISINVKAGMSKKLSIYENVPAKIDGTVIAKVSDNYGVVGEAQMVFPLYGVHYKNEVALEGMILDGGSQGKSYTVEFTATNLYAIEC